MVRPLIDFSDKFTVTNIVFSDAVKYSLKPSANKIIVLKQISVSGDSNFLTNGRLAMSVADQDITSKGGVSTELDPQANFNIDYRYEDGIVLKTAEEIVIKPRVTSGSAQMQFQVTGVELNVDEFEKYKIKFGLGGD